MKKTYLILALLGSFSLANAQDSKSYKPNMPDYSSDALKIDPVPFAPPPPPNPIPIDGGVGFLVAAGIGYGLQRMKSARKT